MEFYFAKMIRMNRFFTPRTYILGSLAGLSIVHLFHYVIEPKFFSYQQSMKISDEKKREREREREKEKRMSPKIQRQPLPYVYNK